MTTPDHTHEHRAAPPWHASLSLRFAAREGRTVLADAAHQGPLRVQRPLYADDSGACEVLVLHPPGGMAGGDVLEISAQVDTGASVLVSTPGAANSGSRLTTMLVRPASGLPIDRKVLRPITTGLPIVSRRKCCISDRRRQGSRPPEPITPFFDTATMIAVAIRGGGPLKPRPRP